MGILCTNRKENGNYWFGVSGELHETLDYLEAYS